MGAADNDDTRFDPKLSPADMRQWLEQEIRDVLKGTELRIKDATDFVTKYATGEISEEEMNARHSKYTSRWGEAIPGVFVDESMSNEQVLARLDEERNTTPQEWLRKINEGKRNSQKRQ